MKKTVLLLLAVIILIAACAAEPATTSVSTPYETSYGATVMRTPQNFSRLILPAPPVSYKIQVAADKFVQNEQPVAFETPEPEAVEPETSEPEAPAPEIPEFEKPMIALTFDDGPSREITPKILALLEEYEARATFCVIGYVLEKHMDIGTMVFESGSELVGHSWNHSYLTKLTDEAIEQQLLDTNKLIEELAGSAPVFYRPPYGAVNAAVREVSERLGLSLLMWSIDPKDWKTKDATLIYEHILENVKEGSVILCHDLYDATLEMVEILLAELTEQGYRFVTVSELFAETELVPGKIYR